MNNREYIESGMLELYATGLLSIEEMRDAELKACQFSEIKTELESLQTLLERYAMKYSMIPPAGLKEQIMQQIESSATVADSKVKPIVRPISPTQAPSINYLAVASMALLVIAAGFAIRFALQADQYKQKVNQLTQLQESSRIALNATSQSLVNTQEQLTALTDPNTERITMLGTPKSPESIAMIYWNKETKAVYLDVKRLPAQPSDKQYQLWYIDPANKPVNAGMFDVNSDNMLKMIDAPDALAFAVTLEPRGGSPNPTMDQMYVIGKVHS